jgi:cob(I)alamin adenosyltransferase
VEHVPPLLLRYLNRLSDLLFVTARALNRHAGESDVLWQQGRSRNG